MRIYIFFKNTRKSIFYDQFFYNNFLSRPSPFVWFIVFIHQLPSDFYFMERNMTVSVIGLSFAPSHVSVHHSTFATRRFFFRSRKVCWSTVITDRFTGKLHISLSQYILFYYYYYRPFIMKWKMDLWTEYLLSLFGLAGISAKHHGHADMI